MHNPKRIDGRVGALAVVGCLILLNVLASGTFARLDLTRDKQFTLSDATRQTLSELPAPITVQGYFSAELPGQLATISKYVQDLLDEYHAHGEGHFSYEIVDPRAEETQEDKAKKKDVRRDIFGNAVRQATEIEKELGALGIRPLGVQVQEEDSIQVKQVYMALVVSFGEEKEVIPAVQDVSMLEYDLTTMIRKVSRADRPHIAFVTGHDGPSYSEDLAQQVALLQQIYEVSEQDLNQADALGEDIDGLIVVGPKTAFTESELRKIDAFVSGGKPAAFFLNTLDPDPRTLEVGATIDHGLGDLLASYGARVTQDLVVDAECDSIMITQQRGYMRVQQPVPFPFMPKLRAFEAGHPITRGMTGLTFPFVTEIQDEVKADSGTKFTILGKSSRNSFVMQAPFDLNPLQEWEGSRFEDGRSRALMVALTGNIKSFFAGDDADAAQTSSGRVLVAGGAHFLVGSYLPPQARQGASNLLLNMVDWMVQDEALAAMRSRGAGAAVLDTLEDSSRAAIKYSNTVGVPGLLVLMGLWRWRRREARRKTASI